jgi:hypothetical protein
LPPRHPLRRGSRRWRLCVSCPPAWHTRLVFDRARHSHPISHPTKSHRLSGCALCHCTNRLTQTMSGG